MSDAASGVTFEPGETVLDFRIQARIGQGGMGEVWQATDLSLDRTVALKALPAEFAGDADRLARFEHEARSLAALNHPHIAGIYGLHSDKGRRFLAMEFVRGENLAARLERGPLPIPEAVAIARGVSAALGAAHAQGIVHRDLKPANVMLDESGTAKVLDFGLAKSVSSASAASAETPGQSLSPTITAMGTAAGIILGTAGYMSPEQARGKTVDRRADIWSLGVILYEMLTGVRAFRGETVSDTLASVLTSDVDWSALPADTPPSLRRLLRRCLQRDPISRLHDADDARLELELALTEEEVPPLPPPRLRAGTVLALAAPALAVGLLAGAWLWPRDAAPVVEARPVTSTLEAAAGVRLDVDQQSLALSPDGELLAYVGVESDGQTALYLRHLGDGSNRRLKGTEGARTPFWSPDGRDVAFHTGARLLRITLDGESIRQVCDTINSSFGSWSRDGTILYSSQTGLWQVPAEGGTPRPLNLSQPGFIKESAVQFLPDGRHFLFDQLAVEEDGDGVYLGQLDSPEIRQLVHGRTNAVYSHGALYFVRENHLMVQAFDDEALVLQGEPRRVAGPLLGVSYPFHYFFSVSGDGRRLVHIPGDRNTDLTEIVWVDRTGEVLDHTEITGDLYNPRLSPDGRLLALDVSTEETHGDLWIFDTERGSSRRLTRHPKDESEPVWSPDGQFLYYFRIPDIYRRPVTGGGEETLVHRNEYRKAPLDISPDGRYLLFLETDAISRNLMVLDLEMDEVQPLLTSSADESGGRFSPDGEWVAFTSDESGRLEVYLERFPDRGERFQVSTEGGHEPVFRANGRELFYESTQGELMAVSVNMDAPRDPLGEPSRLFRTRLRYGGYDVASDGQSFILDRFILVEVTALVLTQEPLAAAH